MWRREIFTITLLLLLAIVAGLLIGKVSLLLLIVVSGVLARQLFQIHRFVQWLKQGGRLPYPKTTGIWEDIYYSVYRIKKNERRRKKKLSKMLKEFRQSTEALPDAAIVLGADNRIEWSNKPAREVFGLHSNDKGQRIPNLIRFPEFVQYLKAENFKESLIIPSPVNNRIILAVRIVTYGANLRLLLAQDVTQLKKMELMRKDFVANVSHELRTPLTVMKGYLETLQDMDDGLSPLLTTSFQQMTAQTERMQHLVDDLLLLAHLETQKKKSHCVDIPLLLNELCKESNSLKNWHNRIVLLLESDAHIIGDVQELRSAFTNLVVNALNYSPEDSLVTIRWSQFNNSLILAVEDKGEGIAETDIPRITERFYRVETKRRNRVKGTGLGLAIVKHVLMRHDGELSISSQLGKGSCFSCHFPLQRRCN
ncbi:MAG: phosphate regulon sensor histidine kinase PhoR [Methylococcaceae bacterium]